jgi:hypothetical protein
MDTGGSGGPLATGTPSTVVVDLGEAPSVVSLARQASVGLSDSGSEGKGSSSVFFLADNKRSLGGGLFIYGKTPGMLRKVSMADSVVIWPYPARILGWIWKGDKLLLVMIQPESMESGVPRLKCGSTGRGSTARHGTGSERRGVRRSVNSGMAAHTFGSSGAQSGVGWQLGHVAAR